VPALRIGQLTSLTRLYLSDNQINGTIPAELSALTNLQVLVLSNNDFVPPVPASVQEMCRQSVSCVFGGNQGLHACGKGYADASAVRFSYLSTCLPCKNCKDDGTCKNGFVNTDTSIMCATCPVSSFPVTGSCMDCPSNPVLSFLLPLGALFSIILLGLIVYKLQKHDLIRLPELNLDLTTMIRIKQLTAVLQVLSVFAALSAVLAPWFLAITDFLSAIAAPVEIQPVCSSYYEKLMNSNYDFLRAWVAFGSMYLCAFVLRRAHKLSFMRSRVSIGTFDKMQVSGARAKRAQKLDCLSERAGSAKTGYCSKRARAGASRPRALFEGLPATNVFCARRNSPP
jgi:hypothetical protein